MRQRPEVREEIVADVQLCQAWRAMQALQVWSVKKAMATLRRTITSSFGRKASERSSTDLKRLQPDATGDKRQRVDAQRCCSQRRLLLAQLDIDLALVMVRV